MLPRSDGTMAFFNQCWEVISSEVIVVVHFHVEGFFVKSYNSTFVALIPKKVGAIELNDFRPNSLIKSVY